MEIGLCMLESEVEWGDHTIGVKLNKTLIWLWTVPNWSVFSLTDIEPCPKS